MFSKDYLTPSLKVQLATEERNMVAHLFNSLHTEDSLLQKQAQQQNFNSSNGRFLQKFSLSLKTKQQYRKTNWKKTTLDNVLKAIPTTTVSSAAEHVCRLTQNGAAKNILRVEVSGELCLAV